MALVTLASAELGGLALTEQQVRVLLELSSRPFLLPLLRVRAAVAELVVRALVVHRLEARGVYTGVGVVVRLAGGSPQVPAAQVLWVLSWFHISPLPTRS